MNNTPKVDHVKSFIDRKIRSNLYQGYNFAIEELFSAATKFKKNGNIGDIISYQEALNIKDARTRNCARYVFHANKRMKDLRVIEVKYKKFQKSEPETFDILLFKEKLEGK